MCCENALHTIFTTSATGIKVICEFAQKNLRKCNVRFSASGKRAFMFKDKSTYLVNAMPVVVALDEDLFF